MKTTWLQQKGADELLLFFNGWGMDHRMGDHLFGGLQANGWTQDVIACHDYRSLQMDADVMKAISRYRKRTVIAWSFGVWAAQHADLPPITRALAINGTLHPIDAEKGIKPEIVEATRSGWSEENRARFNRRMCGSSEALALFATMAPDRSVVDQQEELAQVQHHLQRADATPATWRYDHAIIGTRDLIFPPQQQCAAWNGTAQTMIAEMPHFPFLHFKTFSELLACFSR